MKKSSKLISLVLSAAMLLSAPLCAFASTTSKSIFTSSTYTHQTQFDGCTISQGIDVSYHNGTVDWAKVKAAGVKFVILRAGYRGYGSSGTLVKDTNFETYIKGAHAQGLPIGIYFYSQALNVTEAKAEANKTLEIINNYRSYITLPVAFDYEFADVSSGRLDSAWNNGTLNKTKMTNNAIAFCDAIAAAGYQPMVYANKSFFTDQLDKSKLEGKYGIWLANYTTNTTYNGNFNIWQFSEKGTISGISGNVDSNFMYTGLNTAPPAPSAPDEFTVDAVPDQEYTAKAVKPDLNVSVNGEALVKGEGYYVEFANNVKIGSASVTIRGVGKYADIPAKTVTYHIVPRKSEGIVLTERGIDTATIQWDKNADATGYQVLYKNDDVWKSLKTTTATSCELTGLTSATTYELAVRAYKTVSKVKYYGIKSDTLSVATKPAKVTGLKVSARTDTAITLKWDKQTGASKYIVYQYNTSTKKYEKLAEIANANTNTYKVSSLTANKKYKFRVRAVKLSESNKALNGAVSATLGAYSAPAAPKIKSAKSKSYKTIKTTWNKSSGVSGYQVMWSTSSDFSYNYKSVKVAASKAAATLSTAQSGTKYYVRVRAYKIRSGKTFYSPWSKTKSVTTK